MLTRSRLMRERERETETDREGGEGRERERVAIMGAVTSATSSTDCGQDWTWMRPLVGLIRKSRHQLLLLLTCLAVGVKDQL